MSDVSSCLGLVASARNGAPGGSLFVGSKDRDAPPYRPKNGPVESRSPMVESRFCPAGRLLTLLRPALPPPAAVDAGSTSDGRVSRPDVAAGEDRHLRAAPLWSGTPSRPGSCAGRLLFFCFFDPNNMCFELFSLYLHVFDIPERARNTPRNVQRIHEKDE